MEIVSNSAVFLLGLGLLVVSADWLIQSSVKLSLLYRLTPLFIGMVVIAFGTSAPEAGVGIMAAVRNQKGIALGNVIGSNIANIALILGLCAILKPLKVNRSIFRREIPFFLFATALFYGVSLDKIISRGDGLIFILCFMAFLILSYKGARKSFKAEEVSQFKFKKFFQQEKPRSAVFLLMVISLLGVILGADFMVKGGSSLARIFGISPWIIGITIFAIGTSLPELVASLTASFKQVHSISVGNIVGSNIFNILLVLGIVSLIRPINLDPSILTFEMPALILFSVALFVVMRTKYRITRGEGLALFLGYLVFLVFLLK